MHKIYRSYVFLYMLDLAKVEQKMSGAVKENKVKSVITSRQSMLAAAQADILKAEGFSKRVIKLVQENAANSDDELDPTRDVYIIKAKEG
ncbi:hypothetical protein DXG03_008843 [Asterophora parasitica]|uniref:Uncharacterized protein n=1 Tax=Asterophora parasitica TaxID=117018 RepID=A0A9P7G3Z6_9AGAR|nr:hypothetical protein DXG03_008843 [Asterophora parasitica]